MLGGQPRRGPSDDRAGRAAPRRSRRAGVPGGCHVEPIVSSAVGLRVGAARARALAAAQASGRSTSERLASASARCPRSARTGVVSRSAAAHGRVRRPVGRRARRRRSTGRRHPRPRALGVRPAGPSRRPARPGGVDDAGGTVGRALSSPRHRGRRDAGRDASRSAPGVRSAGSGRASASVSITSSARTAETPTPPREHYRGVPAGRTRRGRRHELVSGHGSEVEITHRRARRRAGHRGTTRSVRIFGTSRPGSPRPYAGADLPRRAGLARGRPTCAPAGDRAGLLERPTAGATWAGKTSSRPTSTTTRAPRRTRPRRSGRRPCRRRGRGCRRAARRSCASARW